MPDFTSLVTWEVLIFLLALFSILFAGVLTGQINTHGLLLRKEGNRSFSPERVQLIVATVIAASYYLAQVLRDPTHLPDVPRSGIALFGGSHLIYIARRFYQTRFSKQKNS